MSIFDRFKRHPAQATEWMEFGNIEDAIQITGSGCRLPTSTPKTEENNNMTDPRIAAIKAETQDLKNRAARLDQQNKNQAVKAETKQLKPELHDATVRKIKAETEGLKAQIAHHKQEAEKRETAKMENELGIRFW